MIYDMPITVCKLKSGHGIPIPGSLEPAFSAYCGEMQVYHGRYWASVQAGTRVDTMVEIPLHRDVEATMFAKFKDHFYSIEQAQLGKDEDGLPVTILSLKRTEGRYDTAGF